jgi:hypothetical protein
MLPDDPRVVSDQVGREVFGIPADPAAQRRAAWQFLLGVPEVAILVPALFYLRFHEVGPLGWGTTVFFVMYCLLAALALFMRPRTEYHSPVKLKGDWQDKLGAWWLVACAFGPLFGWICTSVLPVTAGSWRVVYALRVFFAAGLPLLTAIPLTRYIRGKSAWVSLPLLVVVTLLPVSTAMACALDLRDGPRVVTVDSSGTASHLLHTARPISP